MRFLLVLSYLTIVTCYLTITEKKSNAKTCMKDVLKSVGTETTIVYVYKKVFEDILPEKLEHPFLTIDIRRPNRRGNGRRSAISPPEVWSVYDRIVNDVDRTSNHAEAAHHRQVHQVSSNVFKFVA
ncbi:hypothetical protein FQA39_LY18937 [Lamprigera yunnana]|nr:hypothetical protein FQA39_LY18937 [Lamprigera yunnana]